jgi:hypothetical protein
MLCRIDGQHAGSFTKLETHLQRKRHWFTPRPHRLLTTVLTSSPHRSADFEVVLDQAAASYLWQHRVSGRSLLPGTAMMEASYSAACMLIGTNPS